MYNWRVRWELVGIKVDYLWVHNNMGESFMNGEKGNERPECSKMYWLVKKKL